MECAGVRFASRRGGGRSTAYVMNSICCMDCGLGAVLVLLACCMRNVASTMIADGIMMAHVKHNRAWCH
eukprot:11182389-Lingulodinium_polyedra.AAC.1